MSGDDPLQTTVQEATVDPGEPSVGPTPITQDAGGPSDTILEPDLEDPIMQFAKEDAFVESDNNEPPKNRGTVGAMPLTNMIKEKQAVNNDFYHEPFIFKESEKDVLDLVASSFTKWVRDYDMRDGIKVLTNLRAYNGTTDPDDHLTVFMGIMDVHKLFEPAWCRFFHITVSGAARFCRETLHMADRSDVMVSGAFISGLRPGRLFKDLIAKLPTSLEDLFTQTHNFIRAEDANNENQSYKAPNDTFTTLIKSPAEILATSKGKAMLRPPPRMFAPANKRARTKYCEIYEDHGHDTNDCIDLRKEIEACVRKGRMAHLAKGAKGNDNSQANRPGDDPLIIKADVGITHIHRIYVDGGSSAEIMYEHCFEQLTPEEKEAMRQPTAPLVGFAGQISWPLGLITLPITIYEYCGHISQTIVVDFMIIRGPSPYNIILGRPGLMKLDAVASTLHSLMKFQTKEGIAI
nr:hypothetical protein [Tanacetum cinerariifolium]